MLYKLFFDGSSKNNPGPSQCGYVIYKCEEDHQPLGFEQELIYGSSSVGAMCTNNYAEYSGLVCGLLRAIQHSEGIREIHVYGDSMLVIKQMKGEWKVKSDNLLPMYEKAKELTKLFDKITYTHVYREFNKRADELSNGIDKSLK